MALKLLKAGNQYHIVFSKPSVPGRAGNEKKDAFILSWRDSRESLGIDLTISMCQYAGNSAGG